MVQLPSTLLGLLSLMVVVLCGVIVRLYFQNIGLWKQINDIQEKRIIDAKDTAEKVIGPMNSLSQTVGLITDKIRTSKEVI